VKGLGLDAGALIALERGDERVRALLRVAVDKSLKMHVVAGVVAQTWRGDAKQARLSRFLNATEVSTVPMDGVVAKAVGQLSGRSGVSDVVDVHVCLDARQNGHTVVTSDPHDLARVDPRVPLIVV